MSSREQQRTTARRARGTSAVVLTLTVLAIIAAVAGYEALAAPSSSGAPPAVTAAEDGDAQATDAQDAPAPAPQTALPQTPEPQGRGGAERARPGGVTVEDGVVPDGVTVFDDEFPAVAELDPDLLSALRRAATAAADDGVAFVVTSGWRSAAYQEQLLREAVSEYGSEEEAARWVATPQTSAHVTGHAVDIGHATATAWLSRHGAAYGLCQVYGNEPWHYELHPEAPDRGCPTPYADPTHDPRMQQ